ncbi:hypothetical protein GCM10020367_35030 [Streptomyces sannanensis]|uniref:non-specific serine/threonine protein kinase n=1 Tax=Streptomyces sannanensis TaxID=285536 RepID=A0ABP6SDI2_9ACTN
MTGDTPDQGSGRTIAGRYRLLRKLGAGGMGRVWLAYDEELACQVTLKEIALPDVPEESHAQAARIARARSEARHAARLRGHPHVATVHDVLVHEGLPWIVMEHVPDAIDLQALVRKSGPLPPGETARVGIAVLDALAAGHRLGILHRDVKPANILLAPDGSGAPHGRVLLTDYGIALRPESHEPRLTATAGILGTPGYLAPERARGEPPTPAADIFSLGATLYSVVEGRGPFDRNDEYGTLTALLTEDPTPPVRAGELGPVLLTMLAKDPVLRSSPEQVMRRLEAVRERPSAAFGPPPSAGGAGFAPAGYGGRAPDTPGTPGTPGVPYGPPTPSTPGAPVTPNTPYTPTYVPGPGTPSRDASATPSYDTWNPNQNPYAMTAPVYQPPPGSGSTPAVGPGGAAPPNRRAPRPALIVALVVAAVLVIGGLALAGIALTGDSDAEGGGGGRKPVTTAPVTPPADTGPFYPYGEGIGLTKALTVGDCVTAVWPGKPFAVASPPNLGVVDCAGGSQDGQVMAVEIFADVEAARRDATVRCRAQTERDTSAMADAASYALVPTPQAFTRASGQVACLVLGRHVEIGSEIGRFRDSGLDMGIASMQIGDCFTYTENKAEKTSSSLLTTCADSHTDQVIGYATSQSSNKPDPATAQKLCTNKFGSKWAREATLAIYGLYPTVEETWDKGFHYIACTVGRADGKAMTGTVSSSNTDT